MESISLKPQDIALLVKLLIMPNSSWRQVDIALAIGLSQGEIAKSLKRLQKANLINDKEPNRMAALEFLIHGVKYMFPVELGPVTIGIPTALSSPAHTNMVLQGDDIFVWPFHAGKKRGQSIGPLYPQLAEAVLKDKEFYDIMAAIEILRIGRARERKLAEKYMQKKIMNT